jgi:hypothetical protein
MISLIGSAPYPLLAAICNQGKCIGTATEIKQCEEKKSEAAGECAGLSDGMVKGEGAQHHQIAVDKTSTEQAQKLTKNLNESSSSKEFFSKSSGTLNKEQVKLMKSLKGADGKSLLPKGAISDANRKTLGEVFNIPEKGMTKHLTKTVGKNYDYCFAFCGDAGGRAWATKSASGTFNLPSGSTASYTVSEGAMLKSNVGPSLGGKMAVKRRAGGKMAIGKQLKSANVPAGSGGPAAGQKKGAESDPINMSYTDKGFKDNEISRSHLQLLSAGSLKTFAFYGKHMPTICPGFRQHNSASLFVQASQLFTASQMVFMAESHQVRKLENFFNNTQRDLNFFSQEDKAKEIYGSDLEHFKNLAAIEQGQLNDVQFASLIKITNTYQQDIRVIVRQLVILDEVVDGYNASALMAGQERDEVVAAFEQHDRDLAKGKVVASLPGGFNLMGHIANLVKYVAGISMVERATDSFKRDVERHHLNCYGPYQPMKTPQSRQVIALNSADKADLYRKVLEQKLAMIVERNSAYQKLIAQMDQRLNSGVNLGSSHQKYRQMAKQAAGATIESYQLCFAGKESKLRMDNCSCLLDSKCSIPANYSLRVPLQYAQGDEGRDISRSSRRMRNVLSDLYHNRYVIPKGSKRKRLLDRHRIAMIKRYDQFHQKQQNILLTPKQGSLYALVYKYGPRSRVTSGYKNLQRFLKEFPGAERYSGHQPYSSKKSSRGKRKYPSDKRKYLGKERNKDTNDVPSSKVVSNQETHEEYEYNYISTIKRKSLWQIISKQYHNKILDNRLELPTKSPTP